MCSVFFDHETLIADNRLLTFDVRELVDYVHSTRSDDGGYCFYRLKESNASDTFYAVHILKSLGYAVPGPETTAEFFQHYQDKDGSFQSIYMASYVLQGLALLGTQPLFDPRGFIVRHLKGTLGITEQPSYELSDSLLEPIGIAVTLLELTNTEIPTQLTREIYEAVHPYKRSDGGFGTARSNVYATYYAVRAVDTNPVSSDLLKGVSTWIRRCEWPTGSFSKTPDNTPNYLDEVYQALYLMRAANERPTYIHQTARFIGQLQNANGGFRRAYDSGISSLENSYYAVKALEELTHWLAGEISK
jgi:hypothetical protein